MWVVFKLCCFLFLFFLSCLFVYLFVSFVGNFIFYFLFFLFFYFIKQYLILRSLIFKVMEIGKRSLHLHWATFVFSFSPLCTVAI